jgi:hypothetical protein
MKSLHARHGIAAAVFALAMCAGLTQAAAQDNMPVPQQEPNTLQHLDTPPDAPAAPQSRHAAPTGGRYFIDFRARSALSYGHSFVVFGRTGERLGPKNVAGLHPRGTSSITYMIGHVLPVDSETGMSDGDLEEKYTTARYRVWLTPSQYQLVVRRIRDLQASSPAWHATTFNCNAFIGVIAHFVGLSSPPTLLFPDDFVNSMNRMNQGRQFALLPGAGDAYARSVRTKRKPRSVSQ